jgi:mannose-6-phosphate isomerase
LALALTPFQALCGFLPLPEIAANLQSTPELAALIPPDVLEAFTAISSSHTPGGPQEKAALRDLFAALMTAPEDQFKSQLQTLVKRYESLPSPGELEKVVLTVNNQFPGDIGTFCIFLLNLVILEPGQAIFLSAGEPHAYLSGGKYHKKLIQNQALNMSSDIIECMANSDNVIRAGLTPKLRDVPNLVSGLTYEPAPWSKHRVTETPWPEPSSPSKLYNPPIPEFSVIEVKATSSQSVSHPRVAGPSLVVVTEGTGTVSWGGKNESIDAGLGTVLFVAADTEVAFNGNLVAYRAFVEA